jgi:hypothetical protein
LLRLKDYLIEIFNEYDAPIEFDCLLELLQFKHPSLEIKRKYVKAELEQNNDFFLVDSYNLSSARIWALSIWPAHKKSLYSYIDWDEYEPRVGRVVPAMVKTILDSKEDISLIRLRDLLGSYRHHMDILQRIIQHDPIFSINNDGNISINRTSMLTNEGLVPLHTDSPEECFYLAQKIVIKESLSLNYISKKIIDFYKGCITYEQIETYEIILNLAPGQLLSYIKMNYKLYSLTDKVYLTWRIKNSKELKSIIDNASISKEEIFSYIEKVFIKCSGILSVVLTEIAFESDYLNELLMHYDGLSIIKKGIWYPTKHLPNPMVKLSNIIKSRYIHPIVAIINALRTYHICMTLDQIIENVFGFRKVLISTKNTIKFALSIYDDVIRGFQTHDNEYYALVEWFTDDDLRILQEIEGWIDEEEFMSLSQIEAMLNKRSHSISKEKLEKLLELWPSIRSSENNGIKIYQSFFCIDDNVRILLNDEIKKVLKSAEYEGIDFNDLFRYIDANVKVNGYSIEKPMLRKILKTMGGVAIVRPKVYLMEYAPVENMRLGDVAYCIINEAAQPMSYAELEQEIKRRTNYKGAISSILLTEAKLSRPSRGYYGLKEWGLPEYDPEIHKRINDILYSMIKEIGRPVHKNEIMRKLRYMGTKLNNITIQMDLNEDPRINQIACGVYTLVEWGLEYRDLLRFNLPFKLSIPNRQNLNEIEIENGIVFEYMITKGCLEMGRLLIKRNMIPLLSKLEPQIRIKVVDVNEQEYLGWIDNYCGKWQIMGIDRWYKTYKPLYGESIFILFDFNVVDQILLLTSEQFENRFFDT